MEEEFGDWKMISRSRQHIYNSQKESFVSLNLGERQFCLEEQKAILY